MKLESSNVPDVGSKRVFHSEVLQRDWLMSLRSILQVSYTNLCNILNELLQGAIAVVNLIQNNESVLIQETEDNDAAYLISALAQLVLDPYYRTIEGNSRNTLCMI